MADALESGQLDVPVAETKVSSAFAAAFGLKLSGRRSPMGPAFFFLVRYHAQTEPDFMNGEVLSTMHCSQQNVNCS